MDTERKVHISEGVPLNSGATNIFLGKKSKINSSDGAVIHLNTTEKSADVGVHINTTLSIASSKKIKLLFILNFLLCIICMVVSSAVAFYCWNEMISMRREIDALKEQVLVQNIRTQDKPEQNHLVSLNKPEVKAIDSRQPRMDDGLIKTLNGKTYYVEDLGEDMHLVDSRRKHLVTDVPSANYSPLTQKDLLIVHFNGNHRETNLGLNAIVGPWVRDTTISTDSTEHKIELHSDYFTVRDGGVYMIYSQMVYLTKKPNCYFIWAQTPNKDPRQLATCATGDDSSNRSLERSQISCSIQTVVRLYNGDIVNIAQREPNRTVWLRPAYSYIGFIKLSS